MTKSEGDTLLFFSTASYWYRDTLFFIFLVTPTFSTVKMAVVGLVVAATSKAFALTGGTGIYAVSSSLQMKSGLYWK